MLFWLFLVILAIGIGLIIIGSYDTETIGWIITIISGIVIAIMVFVLCGQYMSVDAYLEKNRETYTAITYKIESDSCKDEFGLLSKEVIDEVQEWNKDVRYYQKIQKNFWVGIFYPNVYDEFETIDYEKYSR